MPSGGVLYGQRDFDADCSDAETFAALAPILPAGAIWAATPLRRTTQTLAALHAAGAPGPAAPDLLVPELMEQNFGDWAGLTYEEIQARYPAEDRRFWFAPAETRPPGGESFADLAARTRRAIDRLAKDHPGRDLVIIAHGGTIRAAVGAALEMLMAATLSLAVDNCALTRIDRFPPTEAGGPPLWRVVAVNHPARPGAASWIG